MARGGINKAVVHKARQAILARGEHPSIDAVRIELGNTGSKTTIHRYLKELEIQKPPATTSVPDLSEALSSLVRQLAEQLKEEGEARVSEAQKAFDEETAELRLQLRDNQQALVAAQQQLQIQAAALAAESAELATTRSTLQSEHTRNATLSQAVGELNVRLADKDEQIASLEDKHQHARDALEHYRAATREQREQDQRRQEAQVQQLQMELRQLQQTLIVKQDEVTGLNRDNERLLVEARHVQRECQQFRDQCAQHVLEARTLSANLAQSQGAREEMQRQNQAQALQLEQISDERRQLAKQVKQLETSLDALRAAQQKADEAAAAGRSFPGQHGAEQ